MRLITVLSGAAVTTAGVFCLLNREQPFINYAFVLCVSLVCSAFLGILSYFIAFRRRGLPLWSLVDGLMALALAYLIFKERIMTESFLPQIIGLWLLFTGALRAAGAIDIRKETLAFRLTVFTFGIINMLVGVYCFYYPLYTDFTLTELIGNIFILQGVNIAMIGFGVRGRQTAVMTVIRPGEGENRERRDRQFRDEGKEANQYSSAYKELWNKLTRVLVAIAGVFRRLVSSVWRLIVKIRGADNGRDQQIRQRR